MQELNLFGLFASRLNDQKLNYMITGSVASIVYGEPRLTHDEEKREKRKVKERKNSSQ